MRIDGTLAKWNDDRGFGFIAAAQGGPAVFVHVSTFPSDGQRPRVGERLSFEIATDKNGKTHATNLVCQDRQVQHATRQDSPFYRHGKRRIFGGVVRFAVVVALLAYGYVEYSRRATQRSAATAQSIEQTPSAVFQCDGRTLCSQMTSCSEATFFRNSCPGVKMDGDRDGIPCEQQWCNK